MSEGLFSVRDKVVVVTGASRGLGRAVAEGFHGAGAIVVGTGTSEASFSDDADPGIRRAVCDVRDVESVNRLFSEVKDAHGRIDVLINNAAVTLSQPLSFRDEDDEENLHQINTQGVLRCSQAFLRHRRREGGSIINVTSIVSGAPLRASAAYCASKAAVASLTRSMAVEWARHRIRVNALAPGFMITEMGEAARERRQESLESKIPMKRLGAPGDVVGAAIFLASDAASYVTGHELVVDGGVSSSLQV
jgi:NAD(P)-dependent dehydrogenase (short-subunit alcohol dehydrogenase family)